jgi:hypothetical protein
MSTVTPIPVLVSHDAAARVGELGMRAELDQMLAHTRQVVPGLRKIEVTLALPYDAGCEPELSITAHSDQPFRDGDRTSWNWGEWQVDTFPPQVWQHFSFHILYGPDDAG